MNDRAWQLVVVVGLVVGWMAIACTSATTSPSGPADPSGAPGTRHTPGATSSPEHAVERLRVDVIDRRPHDVTSYTQGLVMVGDRLFESSAHGPSTLREVDPLTGAVLRSTTIDSGHFAEGIAVVDDRLIQLTWQERTAFVYTLDEFRQIGKFAYDTEGWGLCYDGTRLVMSDGTEQLYFRDPSTFELLGSVNTTKGGTPIDRLNELECVDGQIYANVWPTDEIVRIDPASGAVTATIDATGLLSADSMPADEGGVLNGIAYDATRGTFLLTGKLWPAMFEVVFAPG